jgi:hypothetical protein
MTALNDLNAAMEGLREPYKKAMRRAAVFRNKRDTRGMAQIIVGPPRSGKTTEAKAYAAALKRAKLVADTPTVVIEAHPYSPTQIAELFKSAEGGVVIIDEIFRQPEESQRRLEDYMLMALDEGKCVVILTGDKEPMDKYLKAARPELVARMPEPVETERSFSQQETQAYHLRLDEERRAREEVERQAAELARSKEEWRQMAEDVTLKKPASRMKPVTFVHKNETVS